ncbi:UBX domain-containing protein 4 [Calliopsis andreniformis]|uniref:UBX domain-containing protein 4 n=1 Tax=Calliopsis andreniformis TaxID=337506 RepID=UPI003FCE16F6
MKWFEGSINEAVATSKSRKAVFVVFVEGKDDTSTQVAEAINATEVSCHLEQEHFVAIRLESGSETYRFFAQIYQLVPVPSIFFIGENGVPLEIVAGSVTAADLLAKIDLVLTKAGKNKDSSVNLIDAEKKAAASNSNTNASVQQESTTTTSSNVEVSSTKTESENKDVAAADTKVEPSTSADTTEQIKSSNELKEERSSPPKDSSSQLTHEEKVKRARQMIELQRKQRVEEEERKAKEAELARRQVRRDVQKVRLRQQDLEMKQAHEERLKEKAADAAAREKVRQQIAQDKLERKEKELVLQQQLQKQQEPQMPKPSMSTTIDSTVTRIQFRLPSGNPHLGQFEPTSTLRDLRTYVIQNIDLPFRQFTISTSFPRRDLTHDEDDKTLLELQLVPTAVILILPLKNPNVTATVTTTQNVGFLSWFVWSLFSPIIGVYNYLVGYFSGGTRPNSSRQQSGSDENRDTPSSGDGAIIPNLQNVANSSGLVRRYLSKQGGTTIKTEGNIHRLHSGGDDNDENNTWNGNSTQQM